MHVTQPCLYRGGYGREGTRQHGAQQGGKATVEGDWELNGNQMGMVSEMDAIQALSWRYAGARDVPLLPFTTTKGPGTSHRPTSTPSAALRGAHNPPPRTVALDIDCFACLYTPSTASPRPCFGLAMHQTA